MNAGGRERRGAKRGKDNGRLKRRTPPPHRTFTSRLLSAVAKTADSFAFFCQRRNLHANSFPRAI